MRRLSYLLERMLVRGTAYRLALIALCIVAVSVCGGVLAHLLPFHDFPTWFDAMWWAFLRLTDPGYLGDDHGVGRRLISTTLTVLGYVLFMGALIAIMTQWLDSTLARLERGETPIVLEEHLLVVGWGERSAGLIEEFLHSRRRVRQFLARREGARRVKVVLMVEDLDSNVHAQIAERMGDLWDPHTVIVRGGSQLRLDHLERVNFLQAAAIVLPGNHEAAVGSADVATIKTLMSIASHPALGDGDDAPRVVAELTDRRMAGLADFAYPGALDVVPTDRFIGRILAQNLLHPGLSEAYSDLLSHGYGAALYAKPFPDLAGLDLPTVAGRFLRAAVLGIVRGKGHARVALLGPCPGLVLEPTDHVVLMARDLGHTEPGPPREVPNAAEPQVVHLAAASLRVLCLGWSERLPRLVQELGAHPGTQLEIHVLSSVDIATREAALANYGGIPDNVRFQHLLGDITIPDHVLRAQPAGFDRIMVLGSTQTATTDDTDARTIVAWMAARRALGEDGTPMLVELLDPSNLSLVDETRADVVVQPRVVSALLAHVTLRGELLPVYRKLLSAGGASLMLRAGEAYGLSGVVPYEAVRDAAARKGHISVGVHDAEDLRLLPDPAQTFDLGIDQVLVLAPSAATP